MERVTDAIRLGGFINQFSSWYGRAIVPILHILKLTMALYLRRWSFYMLMIWVGAILIATFLLVSETYHPM